MEVTNTNTTQKTLQQVRKVTLPAQVTGKPVTLQLWPTDPSETFQ